MPGSAAELKTSQRNGNAEEQQEWKVFPGPISVSSRNVGMKSQRWVHSCSKDLLLSA